MFAGKLAEAFKEALNEEISSAPSSTHRVLAPTPVSQPAAAMSSMPVVMAVPFVPVALGPMYPMAEAVPLPGSL